MWAVRVGVRTGRLLIVCWRRGPDDIVTLDPADVDLLYGPCQRFACGDVAEHRWWRHWAPVAAGAWAWWRLRLWWASR